MGWMVLAAVLAGCGERQESVVPEPPVKVKTSSSGLPALPPYEETKVRGEIESLSTPPAMQFFCRYTEESLVLASLQSSGASTRDRYLAVLDTRAEQEGIEGWLAFRTSYLTLAESDRDLWLARNIAKHKLQSSCKHLLSGGPLPAFLDIE